MASPTRSSTARTLPIWACLDDFTRAHFAPAPQHEAVDVLVIGAGVAGLVTAHELLRRGRRVHLLDRGGVGAGESLRTTAHLSNALDDRYYELERWHGADGAKLAAASHAAAIDWIERFVQPAPDACGFRRVPGYLFPHDGDDARLRRERDAAAEAGLAVEFLAAGIPGLPALGPALRFDRQARIQMDAYLLALATAVHAAGGVFWRGDAADVDGGDAPCVRLHGGGRVDARAVVVATNVPFHETVPVHTKQAAYRTYVVACPIEPGAAPDALLWDDDDPYHYVRLATNEGGETMLVVGGEDHKVGHEDDPTAYVRLQAWTRERFRGLGTFTHGWSGQIIEPADGLAFIGADPGGMDNVYVVTGDSGNGVTHGTLGGLLLADLVCGAENPWRDLYDPSRKVVRAGATWLSDNADVARQYADWLAGGDVAEVAELAPGQGAVIRRGVHRVAVYRDGERRLHAHSARCTHLGCVVHWSSEEKSWDCPCHGSRFEATTGAVLNGPAAAPLAPFYEDGFEDFGERP